MVDEIIWTNIARKQFVEILQFWIDKTKSESFSLKLSKSVDD